MDKFHVFSTGKYSNVALQTTRKRRYTWDFKVNIPKYAIYNWQYKTLQSKFLVPHRSIQGSLYSSEKHQVPYAITWVLSFIGNLFAH